jgi:hypothetical protein
MLGLLDSLEGAIAGLRWDPSRTPWANYPDEMSYSPRALEHKRQTVARFLDQVRPATVWDLGANTGAFSRLASITGAYTLALDADHGAVEQNYHRARQDLDRNLLPLVVDVTNPSPGIGWDNCERGSLQERGPAGTVLALALVHHLAIGNNLPFERMAAWLARLAEWLVVEFVPADDAQTRRLLEVRPDARRSYTAEGFDAGFARYFAVQSAVRLEETGRVLHLMRRRTP